MNSINRTNQTIVPLLVEKPKNPFGDSKMNVVGLVIGIGLTALGLLMMVTIILFIPGIFGVMIGLVMIVMNAPKTLVNCPSCGTENKAVLKSKQVKCEGCDTVTPLRWSK